MKGPVIFISILICLSILACKNEKHYSTWSVNGENFSTCEIEQFEGKASSVLSTINKKNGFSLTTIYFIAETRYLSGHNPPGICAVFYYKGNTYITKPGMRPPVVIISRAGKDRIQTLSLTSEWFVNRTSANDSVLISAALSEP